MLWFSSFFRLFLVKNCFCYRLEQTQTAKLIRYKVKFCPWFSFVDVVCVNKSAMSEIYISENLLVAAEKCNTHTRRGRWVSIYKDNIITILQKQLYFVPVSAVHKWSMCRLIYIMFLLSLFSRGPSTDYSQGRQQERRYLTRDKVGCNKCYWWKKSGFSR